MKNKEKYSLDKLIVTVTYEIVGIASIKICHGIKRVYYKSYDVEEFALRWVTDFIKWLEKDDGEEYKPQILTDKEKATPKKPKNWKAERRPNGKVEFNCPVCNRLYTERVNFCASCGQAIDWSEK